MEYISRERNSLRGSVVRNVHQHIGKIFRSRLPLSRQDKHGSNGHFFLGALAFFFLLLAGFLQLLLQVALTVTAHFRFVTVLAKVFGNIAFVHLVQAHNTQLHRALKHEAKRNYYGYTLFHITIGKARGESVNTQTISFLDGMMKYFLQANIHM